MGKRIQTGPEVMSRVLCRPFLSLRRSSCHLVTVSVRTGDPRSVQTPASDLCPTLTRPRPRGSRFPGPPVSDTPIRPGTSNPPV